MSISIQLSVKFRAFRFTVKTVKKQYKVGPSAAPGGVTVDPEPMKPAPESAKVLFDQFGVRLVVWSGE